MRRRAGAGAAVVLFAFASALPAAPAGTGASAPAPLFPIEGRAEQGGLVRGVAPSGTTGLSLDGASVPVASDGRFIIGFDRDAEPEALIEARLADGRTVRERIAVAPRAWRVEHVNVARRPSIPAEAFRRLRAGELERIRAARARGSDSEGWRQRLVWPTTGRISARFGSQRVYRGEPGSYHSGVDVAPGAGAPVAAPADGTVVLASPPPLSLEGNLVILDHGMGLSSALLHLASVDVREGQRVRQGQRLGTVGATGRATGPHLHWSLVWNGARLDPQPLAGPMR